MQPIRYYMVSGYHPRCPALLLAVACIGLGGCFSISLTKKCESSFGLDYHLADSMNLATDGAIQYSIGVGSITIDDQYNHTFLTERGAGGRLIPHEENCWLETLDVMAGDLLRGYLLDRMARPGGGRALNADGSPTYTLSGRLLEISAMKGGRVAIRMEARVIQGDANGRAPKVVLAHVFNVTAGDGVPPFDTGDDFHTIPVQFSRALVELGRRIVRELDSADTAERTARNRRATPPPTQPASSPAPQPAPAFTLVGTDARGRMGELTIQLSASDPADGPGSGTLTFRNHNGERRSIPIRRVFKKRNGLGLKFTSEGTTAIDIVNTDAGCRVVSTGAGKHLPKTMQCDCADARAFLAWRRELKIAVEPAPSARRANGRGSGAE